MLEKVDDSQSLFALLHFLFLCSNDLIPCDMYLTSLNAFYETYVVTPYPISTYTVVLVLYFDHQMLSGQRPRAPMWPTQACLYEDQ
jgi:hypothetical protein